VKQVGRELGFGTYLKAAYARPVIASASPRNSSRPRPGNLVWADRYDRNLTDIFALQYEITLLGLLLRFRHFILMLSQTLAMIID
jgi:hypothetical protein